MCLVRFAWGGGIHWGEWMIDTVWQIMSLEISTQGPSLKDMSTHVWLLTAFCSSSYFLSWPLSSSCLISITSLLLSHQGRCFLSITVVMTRRQILRAFMAGHSDFSQWGQHRGSLLPPEISCMRQIIVGKELLTHLYLDTSKIPDASVPVWVSAKLSQRNQHGCLPLTH